MCLLGFVCLFDDDADDDGDDDNDNDDNATDDKAHNNNNDMVIRMLPFKYTYMTLCR